MTFDEVRKIHNKILCIFMALGAPYVKYDNFVSEIYH